MSPTTTSIYSRLEIIALKPKNFPIILKHDYIPKSDLRKRRFHHGGFQKSVKQTPAEHLSLPLVMSFNARSILGKFNYLQSLLNSNLFYNSCFINIQESWLNDSIDNSLLTLNGFILTRQDRCNSTKKRGGGLLTYVNEKFCKSPKLFFSYNEKGIECLGLKCKRFHLQSFDYIHLINLYIEPNASQNDVDKFFYAFIDYYSVEIDTNLVLLTGDFNRFDTHSLGLICLQNIVTFNTRDDAQLDFVFTNQPKCFSAKKHAPLSTSDHCVIRIIPKVSKTYQQQPFFRRQKKIRLRDNSPTKLQLLYDTLSNLNLDPLHQLPLDRMTDELTCTLNAAYDICCPMVTYIVQEHKVTSSHLKWLRRQKEIQYKRGNKDDVKTLNGLIKAEIKRIQSSIAATYFNSKNPKEIWHSIHQILRPIKNSRQTQADPNKLNSYFARNSETTAELILETNNESTTKFEVDDSLLHKIVRNSKANCAPGPDGLSNQILKFCPPHILQLIKIIIEKSLGSGLIPSAWKTSKITPIPKVSCPTDDPRNYRPIACTSALLKLTEKVVLAELRPWLDSSSDPMQFGFKANRSTVDCITYLVDYITSRLDEGKCIVRCAFLDYKAAFDSLARQSILNHLMSLKVPSILLKWLKDYFTGRSQYVTLGKSTSSILANNCGVPQGAILSPSLFNTNLDILRVGNPTILLKYADDLALLECCHSSADIENLSKALSEVAAWSRDQGLQLNLSKCHTMNFTSKKLSTNLRCLLPITTCLNTDHLQSSDTVKYLGVHLSSNMNWTKHIEQNFTKIRKICYFIRRLKSFKVNPHIVQNFVESSVLPILLYCSPVIFSNLLKKDLHIIARSIKLIAKSARLDKYMVADRVIEKHFNSCKKLFDRVMNDSTHPLHKKFMTIVSSGRTRRNFRHLKARTNMYLNSPIPYIARILTDQADVTSELSKSIHDLL